MSDKFHHRSSVPNSKKVYKGESKNKARRLVGRVENEVTSRPNPKHSKIVSKVDKVHHARQVKRNKQLEVIERKKLGSKNGAPKLVGVIALSPSVDIEQVAIHLSKQCKPTPLVQNHLPYCSTLTAEVEKREAKFTFIAVPRDPVAVADIAKVADVLYVIIKPIHYDEEIVHSYDARFDTEYEPQIDKIVQVDSLGNHFIQLLKAQGLPTIIGLTQGITTMRSANYTKNNGINVKKQQSLNNLCVRYFHSIFDDQVKMFPIDNPNEHVSVLLRATFNSLTRDIPWKSNRVRIFGEAVEYVENQHYDEAIQYNSENHPDKTLYNVQPGYGTMKITGFLRGSSSISANQLLHLTGFGDYQVISIEAKENAHYNHKLKQPPTTLLLRSDENRQSLQKLLSDGSPEGDDASDAIQFHQQQKQHGAEAEDDTDVDPSNGFKKPTFLDWRGQNLHYIKSHSSLSSGTHVVNQNAPVFTLDVIKEQRNQTEDGIIKSSQSVWDSIDSDSESDDAHDEIDGDNDDEGMIEGSKKHNRKNYQDDDGSDADSLYNPEMDDTPIDYKQIQAVKRELKKQEREDDGFSRNSTMMSTLSGFSMGSLRAEGLTNEEIKERFRELPYKEKLLRLLKYGEKGEDKFKREKTRLEKEEVTNADEVEYNPEITARARFVRYRAVKSFRHSVWDHNENLPLEYSRIVQFANPDTSMRNAKDACAPVDEEEAIYGNTITEDMDDDAIMAKPSLVNVERINGDRIHPVTITLANVKSDVNAMIQSANAFVLGWFLFRHENLVSVAHASVKRHPEYELPVKSKDPMYIQIGFRRIISCPLYSEVDANTDKGLYVRFLQNDDKFKLATFYSPIVFTPASVLMFSAGVLGSYKNEFPFNPLVASGTLSQSCNPNKIILKRAVLTGFPSTIDQHRAVVRHMFYNAADVKYFKKVELFTKRGHTGYILQSRGLNGVFKSVFDKTLKEKCQILMAIYKRQFPHWNKFYFF